MNNLQGKKFVASYSAGKDSVLAIYRAIKAGLLPIELITTYNTDSNRSWAHAITENLIQKASASLSLPVNLVKTSSAQYEKNFETALINAKGRGAEVCIFGDIDIKEHREWCSARCHKAGLLQYSPLWKESRKKLVYEFIDLGFLALITVIDTSRMPKDFLGKILTIDIAREIEKSGADICGENGEYHTFVFDGPLFKNKIEFNVKGEVQRDNYVFLDIQ